MQENRKQIIIDEIVSWKENRLLPEHYCDFLLALYTEGEGVEQPLEKNKTRKFNALFLLLIPIGLFLLYFTELSLTLQIVFSVFLVISGILLTYVLAKKRLLFQISLIFTAILLLFISVQLTLSYASSPLFLYIAVGANCLLWLISGLKFKLLYFSISGVVGFVLLLIFIIQSITSLF